MHEPSLIESDDFPFEFLSQLAARESWRKELHRPIYHIHKWWATRLGSVFRGILLGSILPATADLTKEFYRQHSYSSVIVLDPFMGSGTTIGEAHKLGMVALGRDINPVAVEGVRTALGPLDRRAILEAFEALSADVGQRIRGLYRSKDSRGRSCEVLYYFWVMQVECPQCNGSVDLFSSHVIARNANPKKNPVLQVRCSACSTIFPKMNGIGLANCPKCGLRFDIATGPARGAKAICTHCTKPFVVLDAIGADRPAFRLYGKLVLTADGRKEYLPASEDDLASYLRCSDLLRNEVRSGHVILPTLQLAHGHNTKQAMRYNFRAWTDFFNDRQLLSLAWLRSAIANVNQTDVRRALLTLFSGVLEFNNMFASYKGEGTGAVRHMFSHHILKPERTPIEANVWGTPRSSGGFSNLFRSRLIRTIDYREMPTEINGRKSPPRVCAPPFSGRIESRWPTKGRFPQHSIFVSSGDSARTRLESKSIDLVVTDPPFFDNVHYSELADFFYAWQQLDNRDGADCSTRHRSEVQDADAHRFALKLRGVFEECRRVLKDGGLLAFTYHHSRKEGWRSLAEAIYGSGFTVVNAQPVKSEMSVATPKSQAKEPIQLDIILVCKAASKVRKDRVPVEISIDAACSKLRRLTEAGFRLSRNDRRIVLYGQLLTSFTEPVELVNAEATIEQIVDCALAVQSSRHTPSAQSSLFEEFVDEQQ